jgi:hypothetical protein
MMLFLGNEMNGANTTVTITTTGSGTWTVPAGGVTGSIKVEEYGEQVWWRWCKPTRIMLALVELEVLIQQMTYTGNCHIPWNNSTPFVAGQTAVPLEISINGEIRGFKVLQFFSGGNRGLSSGSGASALNTRALPTTGSFYGTATSNVTTSGGAGSAGANSGGAGGAATGIPSNNVKKRW